MKDKLQKSIDKLNKGLGLPDPKPSPTPDPEDKTGSCCYETLTPGQWICIDNATQKKCKELPNGSWNDWVCESRYCPRNN